VLQKVGYHYFEFLLIVVAAVAVTAVASKEQFLDSVPTGPIYEECRS
jgi:hypothetical protein